MFFLSRGISLYIFILNLKVDGAGEVAQGLALVTLPEDPGSVPSTHMSTHNCLELQFQGIQHLHISVRYIHA